MVKYNINNPMSSKHHIPATSAFVGWGAKYCDSDVQRWLGFPRKVEKRFAWYHGKFIPENYLELFQDDMTRIHRKIIEDESRHGLLEFRGMLFYLKVFFDIGNLSILMLKEVFLRPCAEGHKLFKIILFQLSRICVAYRCDLYVECPLAVTTAMLKKVFAMPGQGRGIEYTDEQIPHLGPEKDAIKDYMIIRYRDLRRLDLAKSFEMRQQADGQDLLLAPSFDQPYPWIIPPIVCNASRFPSCDAMNFGKRTSETKSDEVKRLAREEAGRRCYALLIRASKIPNLSKDFAELYSETSVMKAASSSFSMNEIQVATSHSGEDNADVSSSESEKDDSHDHGRRMTSPALQFVRDRGSVSEKKQRVSL